MGRPARPSRVGLTVLFSLLSVRDLGSYKLRAVLTVVGIAFGVAAVTGTSLLNESVARSYERTIARLAGEAILEITNGEAGVPEELLDEVKSVAGVSVAEASVQGFVPVLDCEGERLYIVGLDLLAEQQLWTYQLIDDEGAIDDPLVFLAQPDSVALTNDFLTANDLTLGDRIRVRGPRGPVWLTTRGALDLQSGTATLFGGRLAVMDVFAAQRLLDLDRRYSRINVGVVQGAKITQVESSLKALTAGRALVGRPNSRGETLERLVAGQRYGMLSTGMIAVLVGVFLTFSTMMIAVAQRRLQIGVLRCVGMRRSEVFRLVAIEALTLGAAGSGVGAVLGFGLAKALLVAATVSVNPYLPVESAGVSFLIGPVLRGLLLGPSCALIAALLPAREAMRIQPLEILHSAPVPGESDHSYWRTAAAGVFIMGVAATIWGMRDRLAFDASVIGALVTLGSLTGASFLAPAVLRNIAGYLERPLGSLLGASGAIAKRNLISHMNRSTVTCSALVMSLGGAIAVATVFAGISRTMTAWTDSAFSNFHLIVTSNGEPLSSDSEPFPATVIQDIASLPDVAAVDAERGVLVPYGGSIVRLTATDTKLYQQGVRQLALVEGGGEAIDALARGTAVVVNAVFAREFETWLGATVTLATPTGEVRLPVAAVALDSSHIGEIYVSRSLYEARWRDDSVSLASIMLRQGAEAGQVTAQIRNRWGERHALFIITTGEFHRELQALLAQASASVYPLTMFALTIALFGLTNSLLASVQDRVRTIAMFRSVGATRRQVTRSLMVESGVIGLVGGTCAVLVGSVVGYVGLHVFVNLFYMSILYRYPIHEVIFAFPVAVILAAAAGYLPGRRAANVNISGALSWE